MNVKPVKTKLNKLLVYLYRTVVTSFVELFTLKNMPLCQVNLNSIRPSLFAERLNFKVLKFNKAQKVK